jgi:acyl-CoA thioesterase II
MSKLPEILQLEHRGDGRWLAPHPANDPEGRDVVFSGQILAQMIMASDAAASSQKEVKSIHAVFARAGMYSAGPMELELDTMHSGRAWGSDTITASQGDRLLSRSLVLLNTVEPDLVRHTPVMPDVPGPETSAPYPSSTLFPGAEARLVDLPDAVGADGSPALYFWLRNSKSLDSVAANQAVLAWCQPGFIIGLAMRPHSDRVNPHDAHTTISTGVISHTAHFHENADVAEWLLVVQQASYAGRGRVFGSGSMFTRDGELVSTFAQDSMARGVESSLDPKRSM